MRLAVLLSIVASTACSSPTAPRGISGPDGEILTTLVSRTSVQVGDTVTVDLSIQNPFSDSLAVHLTTQCIPIVQMVSTGGDTLPGIQYPSCTSSTQTTLAAGATISLPPGVEWMEAGSTPHQGVGFYNVVPGSYVLRACVRNIIPQGTRIACAQQVAIEVTQ